jgi:hypothetical protein
MLYPHGGRTCPPARREAQRAVGVLGDGAREGHAGDSSEEEE